MSSETDAAMYEVVAARRHLWDSHLWQVPSMSLTAQAFLLTIAYGGESSQGARIAAGILGVLASYMSLRLMARHRMSELADSQWLERYERDHRLEPVHGLAFRDNRARLISDPSSEHAVIRWLAKGRVGSIWMRGLAIFGIAALAAVVIAAVDPSILAR